MYFKKVLIIIFSLLAIGCSDEQAYEAHYLPYTSSCEDDAKWLDRFLKDISSDSLTRIITVTDHLRAQSNWGGILEVKVNPDAKNVQLGIDTYLIKCGPNSTVSFSDYPIESEIRKRVYNSKTIEYSGILRSGFSEDGKLEFYYYKSLN
ncbi:hypothetical protein [Neptuniibacter sp. QD37_11]|uniref:hypothetical protein n=1 Tax=Neptuniibacter sp. QD37_11 TaxID=3398209 RepID=UPI0039F58854